MPEPFDLPEPADPPAAGLDPPGAAIDPQDAKLVTLARAARARVGAAAGAAVRDGDGRSHTGVPVALPSLALSALQVAVVAAVAAGATVLEAAVVVADVSTVDGRSTEADWSTVDGAGLRAVRDVSPNAVVHLADPAGTVHWSVRD